MVSHSKSFFPVQDRQLSSKSTYVLPYTHSSLVVVYHSVPNKCMLDPPTVYSFSGYGYS